MLFDLAESDIYARPGLPNLIKRKYDEAVRKLAWGGVQGLARAATTGAGKGALAFGLMGIAVTVVSYALLGNAAGMGINYALQATGDFLTSAVGIGTMALGAAIGGYGDVKKQQAEANTDLAETRALIEKWSREPGQSKAQEVESPEAATAQSEEQRLNRQREDEFKEGNKNSFAEQYLNEKRNRQSGRGACR